MPKLPDSVDDWNAPWETATGETEIDKPKLKRYLFGILGDKQKLQESVAAKDTEIGELKKAADEKAREGETETQKLEREKKELETKLANASKGDDSSAEVLRLTVALDKGLTKDQAKRLIGTTEDELSKDADELLASFGAGGKTDPEDDPDGAGARRTPKGKHNPGDPKPEEGADITLEKAMEKIPRLN
jgi:hypothetical protein